MLPVLLATGVWLLKTCLLVRFFFRAVNSGHIGHTGKYACIGRRGVGAIVWWGDYGETCQKTTSISGEKNVTAGLLLRLPCCATDLHCNVLICACTIDQTESSRSTR